MTEPDEDLRRRLIYVAGDTPQAADRIRAASGAALDAIAGSLGLRRRGDGRPASVPSWHVGPIEWAEL